MTQETKDQSNNEKATEKNDESVEDYSTRTVKQSTKHRLISMLVLAVSVSFAMPVLLALIVGQTLFGLFANETNEAMRNLAKQITDYIYSVLQYLSFNSEERSFPYKGWVEEKAQELSNAEPSS